MENIVELTWQMWAKCFWATLITILVVKSFVYPYGTNFFRWFKGKPMLDILRGFGITYLVLALGVDIVPLAENMGINLGKVGELLVRLSGHPIKMTIVTALFTQILIIRWRSKKTDGVQVYGITPPPGPPPKGNDPDGDE